jgi:hypothetical protein
MSHQSFRINPPVSFWVASLASLGVVIGGVGPWATWLNSVSISGTSLHGWREVAVGVVALILLWLYQWGGWLLAAVLAAVAAILGLVGAIDAINTVTNNGAVSLFGVTYRYLGVAWGLYLVLAGTIVLALSASVLAWGDVRARWLRARWPRAARARDVKTLPSDPPA